MQLIDFVILARYSAIAMTSAASAGVWCMAFHCASVSLVLISGAFVGHYNGAKKYKLTSIPTWQMIWFSIFLFGISIPLSIFGGQYFVPHNLQTYGLPYFQIVMKYMPLYCIKASINLFLVSIGKSKILFYSPLIAITVNLVVDIILIFGKCGITQFQGSTGAAIGTIIACISELLFLLCFFFNKNIRKKYNTLNCKLRWRKLCAYLKLGMFASLGHICEACTYSCIYYILASCDNEKAFMQSIASNIYSFLICIAAGLEKGIMSITANLLGAKLKYKVHDILKKGINLHLINSIILSSFVLLFPKVVLGVFVNLNEVNPALIMHLFQILKFVLLTLCTDGVLWILAGILEAGGDMNCVMLTIAASIVLCVGGPVFCIDSTLLSVELVWGLYCISAIVSGIILYYRYKSDKWVHIKI